MNSNQRWFALAAAVAVTMVVVPLAACGTPKARCTPSSCFGCCDTNDQCQAGTSSVACGSSAGVCTSCAFGTVCNLGVCSSGGTGGGGGGGATGGGTGGGTTGGGTGGGSASLPGDTCTTAQALTFVNGTATFTGTTTSYTHDFTSSCANPGQPDRMITFTQPTAGEMTFRLVSTGFQPALSVHLYASGACGMEVGCFAATAVGATIDHTQIVPAGTYAFVVDSATTGGGAFTLTATRVTGVDSGPPPTATPLVNGSGITISGALDAIQYYSITVPVGATSLTFTTTGGTGDVDLYVAQGTLPDPQTATLSSAANGNDEVITITAPAAGVWYLATLGYAAYSGVSLVASY